MDQLNSLLVYADEQGIDIDWFSMKQAESLSIPFGDNLFGIAIDPTKIKSLSDLTHKLAHELGHCATGSFYNRYSDYDCRQKHENKADKWAIQKLIPKEALDAATAEGCTSLWELADYFSVTETLMAKAICWYSFGNLAVELYI